MKVITNKYFSILFFALIAFLLFYGLDMRTFRLWDESRLGVNAANMFLSKNYFYTSYDNAPDFWNTKPHLLILLQVIAMKLFGLTEGSVRIPSAIATLLTCGLTYHWVKKEKYSAFFASLSVLALLCTRFLSYHGARAGDYDALLVLWTLSYCYAFYAFIKTERSRYLFLGFIALSLAVLTKSIAGLLFLPGIAIFILLKRKTHIFLTAKSFYGGLLLFLTCVASYYTIHEHITPGYLQSVLNNEITQRYFHQANSQADEASVWWFYFNLFSITNFYFLPLLLLTIIYLLFNPKVLSKDSFLQYITIISITFFAVLNSSKTKLGWYIYPLFPFIGIFIAMISYGIASRLSDRWRDRWMKFLAVWMVMAYAGAIVAVLASTRESPSITAFIKNKLPIQGARDYKIVVDDVNQYDASTEFQIIRYFAQTQHHLEKVTLSQTKPGDWIIVKNDKVIGLNATLSFKDKHFGIYQIKAKQ